MHWCADISGFLNKITSATYEAKPTETCNLKELNKIILTSQKFNPGFVPTTHFYIVTTLWLDSRSVDERNHVNCVAQKKLVHQYRETYMEKVLTV